MCDEYEEECVEFSDLDFNDGEGWGEYGDPDQRLYLRLDGDISSSFDNELLKIDFDVKLLAKDYKICTHMYRFEVVVKNGGKAQIHLTGDGMCDWTENHQISSIDELAEKIEHLSKDYHSEYYSPGYSMDDSLFSCDDFNSEIKKLTETVPETFFTGS